MKVFTLCSCLFATVALFAPQMHSISYAQEALAIKNMPQAPAIKALLINDTEGAMVEVKGAYNVYDPNNGKKVESAYSGSSYFMYPTVDGLKWGAEFPGTYQLLLVPDNASTSCLVSGIEYRGAVYSYQVDGTLSIVNEVSLEDYVRSVFSTLIPTDVLDKETLAALAIALRTEVLYLAQNNGSPYWNLNSSNFDYQGKTVERQDPNFVEALDTTRNMVLSSAPHRQPAQVFEISWFVQGGIGPILNQILGFAGQGQDARAILANFFPNAHITLVNSNNQQ